MEDRKIIRKSIISAIVFITFVIAVFIYIFHKNSFTELMIVFSDTKKRFILLGFLCIASFSICEALNLKTALKLFGSNITFRNAYKYALAGFFVSSITPSSSGGDPMQLYLMSKDKVPISHILVTLLTKLLAFQFTTITIAIISFIVSYDFFTKSLGNIKYLIFLGIFLNICVFIFYFLMIFCKKIVVLLVNIFCKILKWFHYKKITSLKEKINVQLEEYQKAAKALKENKLIFLKIFFTGYIQMLLYYCIPYFVYLALGYTDHGILEFIRVQSVLFVSVSALPFPGAVGVSEFAFMKLYESLFPKNILGNAMIITRFINFYIYLVYAGIMLMIFIIRDNFKIKR